MEVKVFTWNVLSSAYFTAEDYPEYDKEIFDIERKTKQILQEVENMIRLEYIIVLFEVCDVLKFKLIPLALNLDYVVRDSYYNHSSSGNMGAVLMFPNRLSVLDYKQIVVGQHIHDFEDEKNEDKFKIRNCSEKFLSYFYTKEKTDLEDAKSKHNVLILIKLLRNNRTFTVGAYHMPCAFRKPKVMKYHLETVWRVCNEFSENSPLILCMDMNTTPVDSLYQYLPSQGMVSVNKFCIGKEPSYTTFTENKFMTFPFQQTIDYVWVSQKFLSQVIRMTPNTDDLLPSQSFPSDHLWLKFALSFN
jgi:2',5'-phosphodiesterase